MTVPQNRRALRWAFAVHSLLIFAACVLALPSLEQAMVPLTLIFTVLTCLAQLAETRVREDITVSGAHVILILTGVAVGPASVLIAFVVSEVIVRHIRHGRWEAMFGNIAASGFPYVLAALFLNAHLPDEANLTFVGLVASAWVFSAALNDLFVFGTLVTVDQYSWGDIRRMMKPMAPSYLVSMILTAGAVAIYEDSGVVASVVITTGAVVFTYMTSLVVASRARTEQYASLSWGILSSLVQTLNERDPQAARHSAAVASFSREIAEQAGLSPREQELAHTAGLLHDIGRFSFTDRILERGYVLTSDDWRAVRRHPEVGAEMLAGLDVFGPVADIVRAHHERIDGLGYPDGLSADHIPEIAKIVAVAEVYDTLTARGTYRDRMTSFQALTELRRVAGTQLEERYVEALAALLAGRGTSYRHADAADYDKELAIQKKISDAAALGG